VDYSVVFKNPAVFVLDYAAETPHALQRRTGGGVAPREDRADSDSGVDIDDIDDTTLIVYRIVFIKKYYKYNI
jgi:hypothetical protein